MCGWGSATAHGACEHQVPIACASLSPPLAPPLRSFVAADGPRAAPTAAAIKVERGATDYSKMRIRDLKKILANRGQACVNCLEKSEFVKMCKETEHLEL